MADNVTIPAQGTGTTTPVIATDDVSGVQFQKIKLDLGGDGLTVPVSGSIPVNDNSGLLSVDDGAGSLTVDNGGTFAVQDSEKLADNAAFTDGTTKVLPTGMIFDEVAGTALTENDIATPRIDSKRAQVLVVEDATTRGQRAAVSAAGAVKVDASSVAVPITDNAGSITVDNGGTFTVQDSEKIADNAAFTDGTTKLMPTGMIFDEVAGTALTENDIATPRIDSKRAQVLVLEDATTRGQRATVSAGGALKVDGSAATQPVSGTVTASNTAGDVANDGVDSGNPVKMGAVARSAMPSAVSTTADRVNLTATMYGQLLVAQYDPGMQIWKEVEATAAQTGTAIWTPAAGKKIAITMIQITTGGTTSGVVTVWFGATADTTYTQGTDQVVFRGEFAPSATSRPGAIVTPASPLYAATTDHVLRYTTSAGMTVYITVYGYEFV